MGKVSKYVRESKMPKAFSEAVVREKKRWERYGSYYHTFPIFIWILIGV